MKEVLIVCFLLMLFAIVGFICVAWHDMISRVHHAFKLHVRTLTNKDQRML